MAEPKARFEGFVSLGSRSTYWNWYLSEQVR